MSTNITHRAIIYGALTHFGSVLSAIDAARNSIYIQTYIWKDDRIGRHMVKKLKAAADRGVVVTIRKDVLGTVFELGDMLNGKQSPVYTSAGLKGHKNINRRADAASCQQYRV